MTQRQPGVQIEGVFRLAGAPYVVVPLTVVADRRDLIAHFIPYGTTYLGRTLPDGSNLPRVMTVDEFRATRSMLSRKEWRRNALVVTDWAAAHAIRTWWTADWEFGGWYVNLQRPLERTPHGFATEDQFLDILVSPDRSWIWKDEDELALAVERGRLTPDEATAVREEGERVIDRVERAAFPFDGSLESWRPDPAWPLPRLRDEWLMSERA